MREFRRTQARAHRGERLAVTLRAQPLLHVLAFRAAVERAPIGGNPAHAARHDPVARYGMGHDPDRTGQVVRPVAQRRAIARTAAVSPRGGGQDLQQAMPAPAAANGTRIVGALILGQGRQETHPEGAPPLVLRLRIGRTPFGDIARHPLDQTCAMCLERGQRAARPERGLRLMFPAGARKFAVACGLRRCGRDCGHGVLLRGRHARRRTKKDKRQDPYHRGSVPQFSGFGNHPPRAARFPTMTQALPRFERNAAAA